MERLIIGRIERKDNKNKTKCKGKRRKKTPPKVCLNCSKKFYRKDGQCFKLFSERQFCSQECSKEYRLQTLNCELCGTEFKIGKKSNRLKYCPECKHVLSNGGKICGNPDCNNIMIYFTILKFGRRSFCSIECMENFMGNKMRYCEVCKKPLFSANGSMSSYIMTTKHQNCELVKKSLNDTKNNKYIKECDRK